MALRLQLQRLLVCGLGVASLLASLDASVACAAPTRKTSAAPAVPPLASEEVTRVELADRIPPHWVIVNDVVFTHLIDGRAYIVDADSGRYLAMIPGGLAHVGVQFSPDGASLLVPGTYFTRGSRGDRTDVVTWFALKDLLPGDEVTIPPKRIQALPLLSSIPLSDDGRFMLIYNFTPEQSMTVVDAAAKKVVGEFETPGCALAHMTGLRSFLMQCADGSLQAASLDEAGKITLGGTTKPLFDRDDPATDKPVRIASSRWLFLTFAGAVVEVENAAGSPTVRERWKLTRNGEEGWRPGGLQPYAFHAPTGLLYVLMHEGGAGTHKHPGTEVWVFNVAQQQRVARLPIESPATAIEISRDAQPLLYTALFGSGTLFVRNPLDASVLRKVDGLGNDISLLQAPPVFPINGEGK